MRLRSLRARLLVGMALLVAAGLAVAAVVTYEEQRSFLLDRVDQQVQDALGPLSFQLGLDGAHRGVRLRGPGGARDTRQAPRPGLRPGAALPPGTYGAVLGPTGKLLRTRSFSFSGRSGPTPSLPAHPPLSRSGATHLFTVHAASGQSYRAAAVRAGADTAVVAIPLREVDQTLHRLIEVQALVALGVILTLIALGWGVIRIGLRPLERIGRTASEIASGDLSRRVEPANPGTEVGRLGRSLNEMLGQIESAFADRRDSEQRLRRFLADASHELRTPLAAIRGYAELFRMGATADPDTLARALSRIESEATRMGVLVEDLLRLAQLDQAPEPQRVPVDLAELVEHAADDLRVTAPDRQVRVDGSVPGATVLGDPDQLRQLLANLTRNATIHTPPGTPIELSLTADGEHRLALAVCDHGPGLPIEDREQLFERFWRAEGGRARGRGGAGLGLAIVQMIVAAHGGTVIAGDAPGGGARFVVTLPRVTPAPASQANLSLLTSGS